MVLWSSGFNSQHPKEANQAKGVIKTQGVGRVTCPEPRALSQGPEATVFYMLGPVHMAVVTVMESGNN